MAIFHCRLLTASGSFAVTAGDFRVMSGHETETCSAQVCLERHKHGSIDSAFGEGGLLVSNTKYGEQFRKSRFVGSLQPDHLRQVLTAAGLRAERIGLRSYANLLAVQASPVAERARIIDDEPASSLRKDGRRNFVHPADVSGRFTRRRTIVFAILILIMVFRPQVVPQQWAARKVASAMSTIVTASLHGPSGARATRSSTRLSTSVPPAPWSSRW